MTGKERILYLLGNVAVEHECAAHAAMVAATLEPWRTGTFDPTSGAIMAADINSTEPERAEYEKWHRRSERIMEALSA
ncbi:MAG: hypothetical protein APF80_02295 [Alphaproteobacteria bacterium BRH_c36]|nr:MAG: hypothetical protein APF80_02295 [Alphaproteobacteria bacterium BRH_c36]